MFVKTYKNSTDLKKKMQAHTYNVGIGRILFGPAQTCLWIPGKVEGCRGQCLSMATMLEAQTDNVSKEKL